MPHARRTLEFRARLRDLTPIWPDGGGGLALPWCRKPREALRTVDAIMMDPDRTLAIANDDLRPSSTLPRRQGVWSICARPRTLTRPAQR